MIEHTCVLNHMILLIHDLSSFRSRLLVLRLPSVVNFISDHGSTYISLFRRTFATCAFIDMRVCVLATNRWIIFPGELERGGERVANRLT